MKRFAVIHKNVGETPLAALQAWKKEHPGYAHLPACYAGRLDPMASGKLLVLLGDECKRQRVYTKLDKEYEIEILLDLGSDTGDALGMPEYSFRTTRLETLDLTQALARERGAHMRAYPAFSSKTVGGKPLFLHALSGTLHTVKIPTHIERIYRLKSLSVHTLSRSALEKRVFEFLDVVPRTTEPSKHLGEDFRVDTIRAHWQKVFQTAHTGDFIIINLRVTCASGTYMRSLADRIGASLHTRALALSITRTKIGTYIPLWGDIGFWARTY